MKKIFTISLLLAGILFMAANAIALTAGDPIDKLATQETKNLYNRLKSNSGSQIMFGQYYVRPDSSSYDQYGINSQCYLISGKLPLIYQADYNWNPQAYISSLKDHYGKGGIITMSWHMSNLVTGGTAWDLAGNTALNILPGGSQRTKYLVALDGFANYLLNLKNKKIMNG